MILYFDIDYMNLCLTFFLFFFFNDTATTEIYTLSLHDALPLTRGQLDPPWSSFSDRERTTITCDREFSHFPRVSVSPNARSEMALDRRRASNGAGLARDILADSNFRET